MNEFIKLLMQINADKILDVATGDGYFIDVLINNIGNFNQITGIDSDENSCLLTAAKFKENSRIKISKNDGAQLSFNNDLFDLVSISNSLHHMKNINLVLTEMLRVLDSNGLIIINEMTNEPKNIKQNNHINMHHIRAKIDQLKGEYHSMTYNKNEILQIIDINKITVLKYLEYQSNYFKNVNIDKLIQFNLDYIDKIKSLPQYQPLRNEMEKVNENINEHGIEFAENIIVIGKKNL